MDEQIVPSPRTRPPACSRISHIGSIFLIILCMLSIPGFSSAASIVVDTLADDTSVNGNCSLRKAIEAANTDLMVDNCIGGSGSDQIHLEVAGTLQLSADLPAVTDSLEIKGPGAEVLEILDGR